MTVRKFELYVYILGSSYEFIFMEMNNSVHSKLYSEQLNNNFRILVRFSNASRRNE